MQLSATEKEMYIETAKQLKGHHRRLYMVRVVKVLGSGGPSQASRELGWGGHTSRKGLHELESGFICYDNYRGRGRLRAEEKLSDGVVEMRAIADQHRQTDPSFKSTRLYVRSRCGSKGWSRKVTQARPYPAPKSFGNG